MNFCNVINYDIALFTKDSKYGEGLLSDRYRVDLVDTGDKTYKSIFESEIEKYKLVFFYHYNHTLSNELFKPFKRVSSYWVYNINDYFELYKENIKDGVNNFIDSILILGKVNEMRKNI